MSLFQGRKNVRHVISTSQCHNISFSCMWQAQALFKFVQCSELI